MKHTKDASKTLAVTPDPLLKHTDETLATYVGTTKTLETCV
jgi:hypothetical protein